jgi:hypothetical protein
MRTKPKPKRLIWIGLTKQEVADTERFLTIYAFSEVPTLSERRRANHLSRQFYDVLKAFTK